MIRVVFTLALALLLFSCGNNETATGSAAAFDAAAYELEAIPGTAYQRAVKRNNNGNLLEEGMLRNGVQEGQWIIYHPDSPFPEKAISYVGGVYNGPYMEFNDRGQLVLRATYKNNMLDGPWGKYNFGRPVTEANYKNGQLDGPYYEYETRAGKLQKEVNYKDGKQHGIYRFYNEEGKVTMEYEYRNGEKISGGIVEGQDEQ